MSIPTLTRMPQVVATLVQMWTAALPPSTQVQDGPTVGELPASVVVVGVPLGAETGYTATLTRQPGMGRPRLVEEWTVRCLASVAIASDDLPLARQQVADLLALLDDAVRDKHLAPGVWDRAGLSGRVDWMPMRTQGGAVCNALFDVSGAGLL